MLLTHGFASLSSSSNHHACWYAMFTSRSAIIIAHFLVRPLDVVVAGDANGSKTNTLWGGGRSLNEATLQKHMRKEEQRKRGTRNACQCVLCVVSFAVSFIASDQYVRAVCGRLGRFLDRWPKTANVQQLVRLDVFSIGKHQRGQGHTPGQAELVVCGWI